MAHFELIGYGAWVFSANNTTRMSLKRQFEIQGVLKVTVHLYYMPGQTKIATNTVHFSMHIEDFFNSLTIKSSLLHVPCC